MGKLCAAHQFFRRWYCSQSALPPGREVHGRRVRQRSARRQRRTDRARELIGRLERSRDISLAQAEFASRLWKRFTSRQKTKDSAELVWQMPTFREISQHKPDCTLVDGEFPREFLDALPLGKPTQDQRPDPVVPRRRDELSRMRRRREPDGCRRPRCHVGVSRKERAIEQVGEDHILVARRQAPDCLQ